MSCQCCGLAARSGNGAVPFERVAESHAVGLCSVSLLPSLQKDSTSADQVDVNAEASLPFLLQFGIDKTKEFQKIVSVRNEVEVAPFELPRSRPGFGYVDCNEEGSIGKEGTLYAF